jgi:protein ImuA
VHELLVPRQSTCPTSIALLLAKASQKAGGGGAVAWSDPERELHLPAVSAGGIDLRQLLLLRSKNRADHLWALAECLRCRGVGATVAFVQRLNQIEARRLQLAAERGGGVGLFVRPYARGIGDCYAAATRWLVEPAPGGDQVQRWGVRLLHGHGGRVGKVLLLEVDRETRALRVPAPLADRPAASAIARATA